MKLMSESALRELLERVYEQGYEDGQDRVHNAAAVEGVDQEQKDDYVTHVMADL